MTIRNLAPLFNPRSVAVIGGSSRTGSLGERVLTNILEGGYGDTVYAVNPNRVDRAGANWVRSVENLPETPELAVVVTPSATVPGIIAQLGALGTTTAIVISAGLEDPQSQAAMLEAARPHLMRIVGPNCLGVLMPYAKLNASFAPRFADPGRLGFISQSGALITAMLDWAADRHIGFSSVISAGDMADVDFGDLIDMLAADAHTDAILLYVEGITNPAKFMSAARAAARIKPVIAIKAGRTNAAGTAARSHTGALTGAYDVHAAAFARAGIVLVDSLNELFDAAQILSRYRPIAGKRLAIVTNGGGAGVLASDALARTAGELAVLSADTIAALEPDMPKGWSRANPVDVVGDAHAERFVAAMRAALADPGVDALLVIHCPTAAATGEEIAKAVVTELEANAKFGSKPVIACWMGPENSAAVRFIFAAAHVPLFDNLDDAIKGFGHLLQAGVARAALMRAPARVVRSEGDRSRARASISGARLDRRTMLTATETKAVLAAYGVPTVSARLARTAEAVATACATVEGPWALKLVSPDISHKSDVGGVVLGLTSASAAVAAASEMAARIAHSHPGASIIGFEIESMVDMTGGCELLAGIAEDPTFGPVLAFGAGGKAVELLADRALALPPLDDMLARDMIARTRIAKLLGGYRDVSAVNLDAIVRTLDALSAIAVDFPDIVELDINPLVATPSGVIAVDARARISEAPRSSRLVIRPVPMEWAADLVTRSGLAIHVRPVRPDDEEVLALLFGNVAPEDLRFRFLTGIHEVGHDRIAAMTQIDYRRTMHFIAFAGDVAIASALLASDPDGTRAELAVSVHAGYKSRGVGWTLVEHVMRYAKAEGLKVVESVESNDNYAALALEREAGFTVVPGSQVAGEVTMRRTVDSA